MARREQQRGNGQKNRPAHNPAEQEQNGGDDGQRQRSENAAFPETDRPDHTVKRDQYGAHHQIYGKRFVRPPSEPGSRNVDDHKSEAAESTDLFHGFHRFAVPFVHESVLALHRKQNIGYHDDCHHDQPENIQPFHRDTTPRTAASPDYRAGAYK